MRKSLGRQHERGNHRDDQGSEATEEVSRSAGGEASDPQLCLWGFTRVSADKAVALYMGEVPWDES